MNTAALTDVTGMLDGEQQDLEEELFEHFREAFAVSTDRPCVRTYRAAVAAYDEWYAAVLEGAKRGTSGERA